MQTHWTRIVSALGALAALNIAVHAAETDETRFSARVKLTVSASDSIRDAVTNCLDRELRGLNDVRLVDDEPQWEIGVLALEVKSTRGYRGGIVLSTVILSRFQSDKGAPGSHPAEQVSGFPQTSDLWEYPGHSLHMDASDRLQMMCKQIVADFDAKHLEKSRKRFREMQQTQESVRLP